MLAAELATLVAEDGALTIEPLAVMSAPRRAALLRRWLAGLNAPMPSREMPERIWREVAMAREDAYPCLRLYHFAVRRYQQRLHWVKYLPGQSETVLAWRDIARPLPLPDGLGELKLLLGGPLRGPRQDEAVTIRFRASGNLHIVGRQGVPQAEENLAGAQRCALAARYHAAAVLRRNAYRCSRWSVYYRRWESSGR